MAEHIDPLNWLRLVTAYHVEKHLTPAAYRCLVTLGSFGDFDDGRRAYPGQRRLERLAKLSPSSIVAAKKRGVELGLLRPAGQVRRRGGAMTVHDLTRPERVPDEVRARLAAGSSANDNATHPIPSKTEQGDGNPIPSKTEQGDPILYDASPDSVSPSPDSVQEGIRPSDPGTGRKEGVADASSSLRSDAAAPHDETSTRDWLHAFSAKQSKPYDKLGATAHKGLLQQADRMRCEGWPPEVASALVVDLPDKPNAAAGVIASRLAVIEGPPDATNIAEPRAVAALISADLYGRTGRIDKLDPTTRRRAMRALLTEQLDYTGASADNAIKYSDDPTMGQEGGYLTASISGKHGVERLRQAWLDLPDTVAFARRLADF